MESKIALVVVTDDPYKSQYISDDNYSCQILFRVLNIDEKNSLFSHDSAKDNEYYHYLEFDISVSSDFLLKGFMYSRGDLSYDTRYSSRINTNTCDRMLKTLRKIENKFTKLRSKGDPDYFEMIKEFGRSVKAEKIIINDDNNRHVYSFPEDGIKIQNFIYKIAHKCYELQNNLGRRLRFTDAERDLDFAKTVDLGASGLPVSRDKEGGFIGYTRAVLIDDRSLITQTIEYESGGSFCMSEAELRNTFPIESPHILEINKYRESAVQRRLEKFYQSKEVANESGWRSYDRTFIREVSFMDTTSSRNPYKVYLTIYARFEDFEKESEVAAIWCDRSGIDLE